MDDALVKHLASFVEEVIGAQQTQDHDKLRILKVMHDHYNATLPPAEKCELALMMHCAQSGKDRHFLNEDFPFLAGAAFNKKPEDTTNSRQSNNPYAQSNLARVREAEASPFFHEGPAGLQ